MTANRRFGLMGVVGYSKVALLAFLLAFASSGRAQRLYDVRMLFSGAHELSSRVNIKNDIVTREAVHEVELCLTSVCDMFELRGEANSENLTTILDFALIYTLYASGYSQLGVSIIDPETGDQGFRPLDFIISEFHRGSDLLERYGGNCPAGSEAERAMCVVDGLISRNNIRFYSVRYDQGFRVVTPSIQIRNQISVERIEKFVRRIRTIENDDLVP